MLWKCSRSVTISNVKFRSKSRSHLCALNIHKIYRWYCWNISQYFVLKTNDNKKVLLRERKRHTDRHVANTHCAGRRGVQGTPFQLAGWQVLPCPTPTSAGWGGGTQGTPTPPWPPPLGQLAEGGTHDTAHPIIWLGGAWGTPHQLAMGGTWVPHQLAGEHPGTPLPYPC